VREEIQLKRFRRIKNNWKSFGKRRTL